MKRILTAASLLIALAPVASNAAPFAGPTVVQFLQDFDAPGDTSGWFGWDGSAASASPTFFNQVASGGGALGVTSSAGSAGHAELELLSSPFQTAYTAFGGSSAAWPGFIRQSLDIYIDTGRGSIGDGWALDNAVNDTNGDWVEAGGVGALKTGASTWSVAADGDGASYLGGGVDISQDGWITVVSEWALSADLMNVDRNTYIYDAAGTLIHSNENLSQVALADMGGWRYGWLLPASLGSAPVTLAIDNSVLEVAASATPLPGPATLALALAAMLACAATPRRRGSA